MQFCFDALLLKAPASDGNLRRTPEECDARRFSATFKCPFARKVRMNVCLKNQITAGEIKMKRFASISILFCFLFVATNATSTLAVSAAPPSAVTDTWLSLRSRNFFLVGNASEREMRRVALRLEQFRHAFSQLASRANFDSPVPTTVIVFKNDSSFRPYKPLYNNRPASLAGLFQSGEDMNYIALAVGGGVGNDPFSIIFHEYVHLLTRNNMANVPAWFSEGLAEYYSTFEVSDGDRRVTLGRPISNHVLFLQREGRLMRLTDLFAVNHDSPFYNERDRRSVFYAQSWALVHYLMMRDEGQHRAQLARFLDLLNTNRPVEESVREAFQMDYATLERDLRRYISRTSYPGQIVTFNERLEFDAGVQIAPLSEAEAQAHLGDYLLHINRLDAAEAHLTRALALDENLASAHTALGVLRVRQNRVSDATAHLRRAVEQPAANYLTHYNYAYVLSREGMDASGRVSGYTTETADLMRTQLQLAIRLAPQFAESYHLLAFVNLVMNEQIDESITHLRRAIVIAPGNEQYRMTFAQLYARKGEFDTARSIIEPVARNSAEASTRAGAQNLLSSIAAIENARARRNADMETAGEQMSASSETSATESMEPPRIDPTTQLRPRREGEAGVRGILQRIECTRNGVAFIVNTESGPRRFTRDGFERIELITYTADINGAIGCGARTPPNSVMITYRQGDRRASTNSDGEIVAIEFLPADFDNR